MTVHFEHLPHAGWSGRVDWPAVAKALTENPGGWGHVATYPSPSTAGTVAYQITRGKRPALAVGFEAKSRTVVVDGVKEYRVYARYVGEAGSEATTKSKDIDGGPATTSPAAGPPGGSMTLSVDQSVNNIDQPGGSSAYRDGVTR